MLNAMERLPNLLLAMISPGSHVSFLFYFSSLGAGCIVPYLCSQMCLGTADVKQILTIEGDSSGMTDAIRLFFHL